MPEQKSRPTRYSLRKGCFLLSLIAVFVVSANIASYFSPVFSVYRDVPLAEGDLLLSLRENGIVTEACVINLLNINRSSQAIYEFRTLTDIAYQGRIRIGGNENLFQIDSCHRIIYLPDSPEINSAEFIVNSFDPGRYQQNQWQNMVFIWGILGSIVLFYLLVIFLLRFLNRDEKSKQSKE